MATHHLECDKVLKNTLEEYKKLTDAFKALLRGEGTVDEFNATADSIFKRTNELFDDYYASKGIPRRSR